jgi:hypothetical protein
MADGCLRLRLPADSLSPSSLDLNLRLGLGLCVLPSTTPASQRPPSCLAAAEFIAAWPRAGRCSPAERTPRPPFCSGLAGCGAGRLCRVAPKHHPSGADSEFSTQFSRV